MNYPNPCDHCDKECGHGCDAWRIRWLTIWKQIQPYPNRMYLKIKNQEPEKFVYMHPDEIRQYVKKGPCDGCSRELRCQMPCTAYWLWWDARMEWFRRRWGV